MVQAHCLSPTRQLDVPSYGSDMVPLGPAASDEGAGLCKTSEERE